MRNRTWYRGDCHVHSVHSDGELTPAQLAAAARQAGLDFVATTEHNTSAGHAEWQDQADATGLLVILGEEITTASGHWLALGLEPGQVIDWRYTADDGVVGRHVKEVQRAGGLCVAAHPRGPFPGGRFRYPYDEFGAVEVWNGPWRSDRPWQSDNEAVLRDWDGALAAGIRRGRWLPAIGSSDTHLPGQIAEPQTVVLADDLSTRALLAGLRAGRSWIAESAAIGLTVTVSAAGGTASIGDRLDAHGEPGTVEWTITVPDLVFVRVEVRHPDRRMAALANPVILT